VSSVVNKQEDSWNYTPLPEPIPITEQVWPEGTRPLVCTRHMTYNHENYIRDCIEGVLMQKTTFPVRVCIHDDASTDKTAEIVREYQEKYPNLIWAYYQEENSYRHSKRKEMRSEFSGWVKEGKYQATCEGDDYWIDEFKLEKQASFLDQNLEYVGCGSNYRSINYKRKDEFIYKKNTLDKYDFFFGGIPKTLTLMYRNIDDSWYYSTIQKLIKTGQTGDRVLSQVLSHYGNIYIFDEFMGVYRHGVGVWSSNRREENLLNKAKTFSKTSNIIDNKNLKHLCNLSSKKYLLEMEKISNKNIFKKVFYLIAQKTIQVYAEFTKKIYRIFD